MNVLIIGHGTVGKAISENLCKINDVYVMDINMGMITYDNKFVELLTINDLKFDVVFVCVNYASYKVDGENLQNVIKYANIKSNLVIVKTTLDLESLDNIKNLDFVYVPEFLTEINCVQDYKNQLAIFYGCNNVDKTIFIDKFIRIHCKEFDFKELTVYQCIITKLARNAFLATKVLFFNQIYDIVKTTGNIEDFEIIRQATTADIRIGDSHSYVPGVDGKFGYGGKCFPKDISMLIGLTPEAHLLTSIKMFNESIRY